MLLRVEEIDFDDYKDEQPLPAATESRLIEEGTIKAVAPTPPEYGYQHLVWVDVFDSPTRFHCIGTIDTFATPWEPEKAIAVSTKTREPATLDTSPPQIGIRRAKPGIHADSPFFEGQPDEEPAKEECKLFQDVRDGKLLEMVAGDCRKNAWLLDGMVRRLEKAKLAPAWHSVDEPPEDGTLCWVTNGQAVWLAQRTSTKSFHAFTTHGITCIEGDDNGRIAAWCFADLPAVPAQ